MTSAGYGQELLFNKVNLDFDTNFKLGLVGRNGYGKTTLLKLLQNQLPYSGEISRPVNFNYFSLPIEDPTATVCQNLLAQMSMGEQKRVELAKSLLTPAQLFIWDEPLNYLDLYNNQQIIEVINQYQPTMLLVEHDRTFLDQVSTQEIYLSK